MKKLLSILLFQVFTLHGFSQYYLPDSQNTEKILLGISQDYMNWLKSAENEPVVFKKNLKFTNISVRWDIEKNSNIFLDISEYKKRFREKYEKQEIDSFSIEFQKLDGLSRDENFYRIVYSFTKKTYKNKKIISNTETKFYLDAIRNESEKRYEITNLAHIENVIFYSGKNTNLSFLNQIQIGLSNSFALKKIAFTQMGLGDDNKKIWLMPGLEIGYNKKIDNEGLDFFSLNYFLGTNWSPKNQKWSKITKIDNGILLAEKEIVFDRVMYNYAGFGLQIYPIKVITNSNKTHKKYDFPFQASIVAHNFIAFSDDLVTNRISHWGYNFKFNLGIQWTKNSLKSIYTINEFRLGYSTPVVNNNLGFEFDFINFGYYLKFYLKKGI